MLKLLLKRVGCSDKNIARIGLFLDFLYWSVLIYLIFSSNHYFYNYCGVKIAEIEQKCTISCFNYTPTEHNWTNVISESDTGYNLPAYQLLQEAGR